MLVLTVNKGKFVSLNEGEVLIQIKNANKKGLSIKVYDKNEKGNYEVDNTYFSEKDNPVSIDGMQIIHLKGKGRQIRVGFEGEQKVQRCPENFKFNIERPRNLDDDFFNFDTEGY